jgi:hypothetical protein
MRHHAVVLLAAVAVAGGCGGGGGGQSTAEAGAGDGGGLPACALGPTMADVEQKLFRGPKCSPCHGVVTLYPTSLDLASDGLAARIVDKQAAGNNPLKGMCDGHALLPANAPLTGLFVEKVADPHPSCGDPMPQGMPRLTADEIACVKRWALQAAKAAGGP